METATSVPGARPAPGPRGLLRIVGPGIVVAATGVGAGDMVSAAKAGAVFGFPVLWAAALGALLKFSLAEGIARWQLATGAPILGGWVRSFGWPVRVYFVLYLVLWSFIVSAALMSACGLALHALVPSIPVGVAAAVHGVVGFAFVWFESYRIFERTMKWAIGGMFVAIVGTAIVHGADAAALVQGLFLPRVPEGSILLVLGMVGGVGGTLTLLSYSYWMEEKGWRGPDWIRGVRFDLGVGYVLTGVFGICLVALAAEVLLPRGIAIEGSRGVLDMAVLLGERFGRAGELVFLVGFWAAVASSLLGVWQGVPYLFAHYRSLLGAGAHPSTMSAAASGSSRFGSISTRSAAYRGFLFFLTFPPMLLLLADRPVWLVVLYAAVGALFMPFLAATLLVLNNRRELGRLRNGWLANAALLLCLALFAYLAIEQIRAQVAS